MAAPEYLGKKIEAYDVKMAMLAVLIFPLRHSRVRAISGRYDFGLSSIANPGPHGFSEIFYAFTRAQETTVRHSAGLEGQHPLVQHHDRRHDRLGASS